jgi:ABC-type proline/glycine betaine transport system substrate-binding protein
MLDDQQIGALMDAMNRAASQQEAAVEWMGEHKELVDSWIQGN